jgi:hypothetical protein
LARSLAGLGIRARLADSGVRLKHAITHRSITVEVWRAETMASAPRAGARARWAAPGSRALALTALARRVIGNAGEVLVASASPARALARPVMLPRRQSVI